MDALVILILVSLTVCCACALTMAIICEVCTKSDFTGRLVICNMVVFLCSYAVLILSVLSFGASVIWRHWQ